MRLLRHMPPAACKGTFALPAQITEGYIQVVGTGGTSSAPAANCQGALGTAAVPAYYTIKVVLAKPTISCQMPTDRTTRIAV
ncbi:MAG: hypothetical protein ACXWNK_18095 [Vulcanimicrobiaceae bacterium]